MYRNIYHKMEVINDNRIYCLPCSLNNKSRLSYERQLAKQSCQIHSA